MARAALKRGLTTSRSAITRRPWAPSRGSPQTTSTARAMRSRPRMNSWRRFVSYAGSSATSSPTAGSILQRHPRGCAVSVHGGQRMPRRELTKRVEEALRNPYVRCLSHARAGTSTGGRRTSSARSACVQVAWEERVALEVNGLPVRLDLSGESVRDALSAGVRIVCSTDARSVRGLENMTLAVATARRGWATAAHVVDSYEPATRCARRFWFEPTQQEPTSGPEI